MNGTITNDNETGLRAAFQRMSPRRRRAVIALGALAVIVVASLALGSVNPSLPDLRIADGVDAAIEWVTVTFGWFFDGVKFAIIKLLVTIENVFLWVPWVVWVPLLAAVAWKLLGPKSAIVFAIGLLLIVSFGLWDNAISTLSLIATAMVFILVSAIPIGIAAARNDRFEALLRPVLDAMQTIPSLVYLIPIIFLLSSGKAPAIVATMIYAMPPAIRLTNLGLRQVSAETKEAALSFGATRWQMLFKVELPLAMPTIMAGVNQATMMAVAMVVIAALIGAGGLGNDVLFAMGRVRVGEGFEAGLSLLILAIVLDRITQALGTRQKQQTS